MKQPAAPAAAVLALPAARAVDCISDLHLHPAEPATLAALAQFLAATPADAVCLLGDVFEAWVGDDALGEPGSFEAQCAAVLRASPKPLYALHGNRDFLLGAGFEAATGCTLLPDPVRLRVGSATYVLSHGDALCLDDTAYLAFRAQVRGAAWQRDFLARPLAERRAIARRLRAQSEAQKASGQPYADVDAGAARAVLDAADARVLVHGHTHRPAAHALGDGRSRLVLADWDIPAGRGDALRLHADGRTERIALA